MSLELSPSCQVKTISTGCITTFASELLLGSSGDAAAALKLKLNNPFGLFFDESMSFFLDLGDEEFMRGIWSWSMTLAATSEEISVPVTAAGAPPSLSFFLFVFLALAF